MAECDNNSTGFPTPAGANGDPGLDGNTVLFGTGAPADGIGKDGDFYIDNTDPSAPLFWGPKASGTWAGAGPNAITGAQGDPGDPGSVIIGNAQNPGASNPVYIVGVNAVRQNLMDPIVIPANTLVNAGDTIIIDLSVYINENTSSTLEVNFGGSGTIAFISTGVSRSTSLRIKITRIDDTHVTINSSQDPAGTGLWLTKGSQGLTNTGVGYVVGSLSGPQTLSVKGSINPGIIGDPPVPAGSVIRLDNLTATLNKI